MTPCPVRTRCVPRWRRKTVPGSGKGCRCRGESKAETVTHAQGSTQMHAHHRGTCNNTPWSIIRNHSINLGQICRRQGRKTLHISLWRTQRPNETRPGRPRPGPRSVSFPGLCGPPRGIAVRGWTMVIAPWCQGSGAHPCVARRVPLSRGQAGWRTEPRPPSHPLPQYLQGPASHSGGTAPVHPPMHLCVYLA